MTYTSDARRAFIEFSEAECALYRDRAQWARTATLADGMGAHHCRMTTKWKRMEKARRRERRRAAA